jgi:hypothetical protein
MSRRCTKCDREPSGLIPRQHDFCEFCGERLPIPEPERVPTACYRCGKKFETVAGVTMCPDCQKLPVPATTPLPVDPENNFAMAAVWGAALPIMVRVSYGMMVDSLASREAKLLAGGVAFFASSFVLAGVGLATGQRYRSQSAAEQAIAWLALAVTAGLLWLVT